ncbi:hypothetical protein WA577_002145, partial [Blastocystis sp. JDR]
MPQCYLCGKEGHIAKDCRMQNRAHNDTCYVCGGRGHIAAVCPSRNTLPGSSFGKAPFRPARRSVIQYPRAVSYHPANTRTCYICGKAGHMAKDCRQQRTVRKDNDMQFASSLSLSSDSFATRKICNNCHKEGHLARDCTEPLLCRRCGQPGHIAAVCTNEIQCKRCLQLGHLAKDCPNAEVCYFCHQSGHSRDNCPNRDK